MSEIRESSVGYWVEIPDKVSDMGLSTHAFRLYIHLKKVAERNDGTCREGVRELARRCNISAATIFSAKKELLEAGLIKIEKGKPVKGHFDTISVTDI